MNHPLLIIAIVVSGLVVGWISRDFVAEKEILAITAAHDAERKQIAEQLAQAERDARTKEQEYARNTQAAAAAYARNERTLRARVDASRVELDGLRGDLAAVLAPRPAASTPGAAVVIDGAGTVLGELLGACAASLQGMAAEADRLALKLSGLQDYIRATQ